MEEKDKSEPDADEKLIKWNDVFQELLIDSKILIKALSEGINYTAISAGIVFAIGLAGPSHRFRKGHSC